MNRTIKFRKWDFEEKVMIDGDSLAFDEYAPVSHLLSQPGIMQYTGLTDRNGKEIYEGDIVEREYIDNRSDFAGVVTYLEGSFFLVNPENEFDSDYLFDEMSLDEVIGNIWENANLLNFD